MCRGSCSSLEAEGKYRISYLISTYSLPKVIDEVVDSLIKGTETEIAAERPEITECNTEARILANLERFREKPIEELTREEIHTYIELLAASGVEA